MVAFSAAQVWGNYRLCTHKADPVGFGSKITTGDETWVHDWSKLKSMARISMLCVLLYSLVIKSFLSFLFVVGLSNQEQIDCDIDLKWHHLDLGFALS